MIIDVRINNGGSDASFLPLLEYIMPQEGVELYDEQDVTEFYYTINNSKRQLAQIEEQLQHIDDESAKQVVLFFQKQWAQNAGKGFVAFDTKQIFPDTFITGKNKPHSVVLLSDVTCGSSGDSFVEICKKSSKVTVIGRPTKGLNDYANLAYQKWDEGFELWYPTSRLKRINQGKGIEPHIYIPWTPEHLVKDIDLETALKLRK